MEMSIFNKNEIIVSVREKKLFSGNHEYNYRKIQNTCIFHVYTCIFHTTII